MSKIVMKTSCVVDEILKPTKAAFFKDIEPGHRLVFLFTLRKPGYGYHGRRYANRIEVKNRSNKTETVGSETELSNRLKNFVLTQYD